MADFDMGAAVAEYNTLMNTPEESESAATGEQGATAVPGEQGATPLGDKTEGTPTPTKQEIANFFETMMDGKPLKLPYNLELPIKHNGELIKLPLEKLVQNYRQNEHLQSKHKEFQTKQQEFESKVGDWTKVEELKNKYGALQEWSEANPDQFERIWQLFQSKDKVLAGGEFNPLEHKIQSLEKQLMEMGEITKGFKSHQEEQAAQKDIALIDGQISEFSKEFPYLDLSEKDLDGIPLSDRIIQYGIDKRHPDFFSAAMTYPGLRKRLVEGVRESVKTDEAKRIKSDFKNGIIARNTTPNQVKAADPLNVRRMSEKDRDAMALEELKAFGF